MALNINEIRNICKLSDITLIESRLGNTNAVVVLDYTVENFIWLCKSCGTSVIFYNALFYDKNDLYINEATVKAMVPSQEKLAAFTERVDAWNKYIENADYDNAYQLILIASIDGVTTAVKLKDYWLRYKTGLVEVTAFESTTTREIAGRLAENLFNSYNKEKSEELLMDLCETLLADEDFRRTNNISIRCKHVTNYLYGYSSKDYNYVDFFRSLAASNEERFFDKYANQLFNKLYDEYKKTAKKQNIKLGDSITTAAKDDIVRKVVDCVMKEWEL